MTDQYRADAGAAPDAWPYAPRVRTPEGLAIASAVIAVVLTAIEIATAVASVSATSSFREAIQEGRSTYDVFTLYDGLELLLFPVMIGAYVVSCLWLQFARAAALGISPHYPHQRSTVWVWLGWWVPIVSLWFPYQVVRDIRDGSQQRAAAPLGLGLWWTAWLVYLFGTRFTANIATSSDPDIVGLLTFFEVVTTAAAVVACVQWCRILHRVTVDQQEAVTPGVG